MTYADVRWDLSILKGKSTLLQISFTWTKLYISVFSSYFRQLMAKRQLQSIEFQAPCKRTRHCWMLHVASVCTPCCMLLDVVACCCAKFETGQTFQPTTPNISFIPWSPKRSPTMLYPFAQLFQRCWGHARTLRMVYKDLRVVSFPRCVGSCCVRLDTTANTRPTTANIVGATMLGVVASVCTQPECFS